MSVTIRNRSNNPNVIPKDPSTDSVRSDLEDSIEELPGSESPDESSDDDDGWF